MINFIVQTNLLNQDDLQTLLAAIQYTGVKHYPVKIIPFDYSYIDGEPYDGFFKTIPVIAVGSTTMIKVARSRGWSPGVWAGYNFKYDKYIEHYGDAMLNHDAQYYRFKDVPLFSGSKFIRPVKDDKSFPGIVIESERFREWQDLTLELDAHTFPETPVIVSDLKNIDVEYRFFVVNGKIIDGSMYMYRGRLSPRPLEYEYDLDTAAMAYAQSQVDRWQPAPAFVIDIAATNMQTHEFKILEINGFNAAGYYKTDVVKVLQAIVDMYQ